MLRLLDTVTALIPTVVAFLFVAIVGWDHTLLWHLPRSYYLIAVSLTLLPLLLYLDWVRRFNADLPKSERRIELVGSLYGESQQLPLWTITLPLGVVLMVATWPIGEEIAKRVPRLSNTIRAQKISLDRPGALKGNATFHLIARGRGNPSSVEMQFVHIYPGGARDGFGPMSLGILLPKMRAFEKSLEKTFPFNRSRLMDFVRNCANYTEEEVTEITDKIWGFIQNCLHNHSDPSMDYGFGGAGTSRYYVEPPNVFLATALFVLTMLLGPSWFLTRSI